MTQSTGISGRWPAGFPARPFRVAAVLFDFDGTLTSPGALDFPGFAREIGCPATLPVLEYIEGVEDPQRRAILARRLEVFEMTAAAASRPNAGAEEAVLALADMGLPLAILSRNGSRAILRAFENFPRLRPSHFRVIISRDDPVAPKPAPDGILLGARRLGVPPSELLVVGDYVLDLQAARAAGAIGVHLRNHGPERPQWEPHFHIPDLTCLPDLVALGLPLPNGKLPGAYLEPFLRDAAGDTDPDLVVAPGVGEDVAVVRLSAPHSMGPPFLALTADPITFATDAIEDYLVAINANDMATAAARPRWFLATVLLPSGTTPSAALHLLRGLQQACRRAGVVLAGGHTEITDAVTRPVLAGCLAGTAVTLVRKDAMRPGDHVLLTKCLAVEGTALLARELGGRLKELGMSEAELSEARELLAQISVTREAELATAAGGVSAMHDVTEGGVAEAMIELSRAGRHLLLVDMERIPISPLTARISAVLGVDALGLIGSGSLLLTVRPAAVAKVEATLTGAGIMVADIGQVGAATGPEIAGVKAMCNGKEVPWPRFAADEAARVLAGHPFHSSERNHPPQRG